MTARIVRGLLASVILLGSLTVAGVLLLLSAMGVLE